ncbi:MAG: hypothetical protein U1F48_04125 [Burkholderiales bacterium]
MAARIRLLPSVAVALTAVLLLGGCATRFDAQGRQIYVWQFGQDTERAVDRSNPRLPLLPKWRPKEELWPVPSPFDFSDLSPYSFLAPQEALGDIRLSDNAACAVSCDSNARPAPLASRADARGSRSRIVLAAR